MELHSNSEHEGYQDGEGEAATKDILIPFS